MNCDSARLLLDPYLDGELGVERSVELEQHLDSCGDCPRDLEGRRALGSLLRDKFEYQAAPLALHRAIRNEIAKAEPEVLKARASRARPREWMRMAASLVLVAGLSSAVTYYSMLQQGSDIAGEVFASHIRGALSGDRMIDVVSSNEHTVKPWFNSRLDYAPPVKDLAKDGFPLAGGRLDYVAGRRVAALVYHHNKHVVTLFVWPSSAGTSKLLMTTRRGESICHWVDDGMTYWVVSDVESADLREFCKKYLLAEAIGEPPAPNATTTQ